MALKPSPRQVALVQESVNSAIHSPGYSKEEKEQLEEFSTALDHYLIGATL